MSPSQIEILGIAIITAAACALPGVFLVLQRKAMLADAISHTVLLGIVLGFFIAGSTQSPLLVLGAAAVGVLTVALVAALERTGLVKVDAAIGLVFPALFAAAVLLITLFAGNVHLDIDAVLIGEIAFAPFDRIQIGAFDLGPRGLWWMGAIFLVNLGFILLFYKELKLTSFDAGLAASLGFAPAVLHIALMSLVSVTVVGAFDIVGSVLVVALMIGPAAAAYLLTERLSRMLALSVALGTLSAVSGYWLAWALDASIAGSMAAAVGVVFGVVLFFAPRRGLIAAARQRREQRLEFAVTLLAGHLLNHEQTPDMMLESRPEHLGAHMRWPPDLAAAVLQRSAALGLVELREDQLWLTAAGRQRANHEFLR